MKREPISIQHYQFTYVLLEKRNSVQIGIIKSIFFSFTIFSQTTDIIWALHGNPKSWNK
jgi:hypothetical protein